MQSEKTDTLIDETVYCSHESHGHSFVVACKYCGIDGNSSVHVNITDLARLEEDGAFELISCMLTRQMCDDQDE